MNGKNFDFKIKKGSSKKIPMSVTHMSKAFYRQGQRQQFQPHFTCGRFVALQCIVSTIRYLFFLNLHVESIATTPLDTIINGMNFS